MWCLLVAALATASVAERVSKCCPLGRGLASDGSCVQLQRDLLRDQPQPVHRSTTLLELVRVPEHFKLAYGLNCTIGGHRNKLPYFLQDDGSLILRIPHALFPLVRHTADEYCLDTFVSNEEDGEQRAQLKAFVCFPEEIVKDNTFHMAAFVTYWSLLAAFFWLNIMCYDIWRSFSGMAHVRRSHTLARRRYAAYCAYAFGWPSVLTAVLAALEFTSDSLPDYVVTPRLRKQGCFLYGDAELLYLYFPMLILCIANTLLFILTALRIASVHRQIAVLLKGDFLHDQFRKDKQRLLLYVKLFAVMGINWALEVVSSLFPRVPVLWKITDAYNVLIGPTIFVIFICKRKIFRLIRKRYEAVAHGVVPSRSHTCSTRNTSSKSREELRLAPLASHAPADPQPPHVLC